MVQDWFAVDEVEDELYRIREKQYQDTANIYLLTGEKQDLLIDTGTGLENIEPVVSELSNNPKVVVNTHAHFDHAGGNEPFDIVYIHEDEEDVLRQPDAKATGSSILHQPLYTGYTFTEPMEGLEDYEIPAVKNVYGLQDGNQLSVDRYTFDIVHVPGHSPSDIALYEEDRGYLFTGDTVYASGVDDTYIGALIWNMETSDIPQYLASLDKLSEHEFDINLALPGHGPVLDDEEYHRAMNAATGALRSAHVNEQFNVLNEMEDSGAEQGKND